MKNETDLDDRQVDVDPVVIEEDQVLSDDESRADYNLKAAKRRKEEAHAALCQLRWEMTKCPHGPLYPLDVYAAAVGRKPKAIQVSVDTWERSKDDDTPCAYAEEGTHFGARVLPTDEEIDKASRTKHAAEVGELKALAADMLARHFGVTTSTITNHHTQLINEAVARLRDEHGEVTLETAKALLNNIALTLREERDLRNSRERAIRKWMAANRGLDYNEVKTGDVNRVMVRIEHRVEKGATWEEAEAAVRDFDAKASEADRINNEMRRKFALALLNLTESAADLKKAALAMVSAARSIEQDGITIDPDSMEIVLDDINEANAAVSFAKSALTGASGVDWDEALQRFFGGVA